MHKQDQGAGLAAAMETVSVTGPLGLNTITYTGCHVIGDMERLRQSPAVRLLTDDKDCSITVICDNAGVTAWEVQLVGFTLPFVVKLWPLERVAEAAEQLAAEAKAASLYLGLRGAFEPTICLAGHLEVLPRVGANTISVSAGQSLEQALAPGGAVADLSVNERLELAALVAASQMLVRHRNDQVADGARMHRDTKPGNMCVRRVDGKWLPVVMDFKAWCRQDKTDFFSAFDARAMDKTLAALDEEETCAAAESAEGMRAMTHPTINMAQNTLCVLQTVHGALPEALDLGSYGPDQAPAFCTAWRQFDFGACAQMQALTTHAGQHAREYVLRCTDGNPTARPQTGLEALNLPSSAAAGRDQEGCSRAVEAGAQRAVCTAGHWTAVLEPLCPDCD